MKKLTVCALLLAAVCGCGKSESGSNNLAQGGGAATGGMQNTVAQASGSQQPVLTTGAGTEPGEVVALFLDSLRRGDETAANAILTAQAQAELSKTDFVIQPLGTPEGTYRVGRVGFPDPTDQTVALVECLWSEPSPQAGEPAIELDIVCEVRHEAPGWRISGLAVTMAGTDETLVLDFEDAASLQQALQQANGQPASSPQMAGQTLPGDVPALTSGLPAGYAPQQQFALPTDPGLLPGGLPTSGLPGGATGQAFPSGQIALPPAGTLPGELPVNR
jgi:hypothetical protein